MCNECYDLSDICDRKEVTNADKYDEQWQNSTRIPALTYKFHITPEHHFYYCFEHKFEDDWFKPN